MKMNNKVTLIGNVGKDPEVRHNDNGTIVARFSLATADSYKNHKGEWVNETTWHNIVAWGAIAERIERLLQKGSNITVDGKLLNESWTDREGVKKSRSVVRIHEFMTHYGTRKLDQSTQEIDNPDYYR